MTATVAVVNSRELFAQKSKQFLALWHNGSRHSLSDETVYIKFEPMVAVSTVVANGGFLSRLFNRKWQLKRFDMTEPTALQTTT